VRTPRPISRPVARKSKRLKIRSMLRQQRT
jgi:hypothetical protein